MVPWPSSSNITRVSQHTGRTGAPFCPSFSNGLLGNVSLTYLEGQFHQQGRGVLVGQTKRWVGLVENWAQILYYSSHWKLAAEEEKGRIRREGRGR